MNRMISFGYGFVDGKLSVIAEEAEIVKGIFSDYKRQNPERDCRRSDNKESRFFQRQVQLE